MRPPVPFELKALGGNPGKRPLHPGPQPTQTDEPPEPLPFLSETAKAEWRRVAPELHRLGLLTILDHVIFGTYCAAYGRWADARPRSRLMAPAIRLSTHWLRSQRKPPK